MNLLDEIRLAQRNAGENAVIANLRRQGLIKDDPEPTPQDHQALSNDINDYQNTIAKFRALVTNVHKAKGRYHSQLAMCALYDACGLPNVKPISGETK